MYLAGLIAEDEKFSQDDLQTWVSQALSQNISEYTVPWVAAGNPHGYTLARKWIDDKREHIRVRYQMNNFIISTGVFVTPLTKEAIAVAKKIGPVSVDKEGTACKTPDAVEAIAKIEGRGSLGKKKKTVKC